MGYRSKAFAGERIALSHDYWAQVRPLSGGEALELAELTSAEPNVALQNRGAVLFLITRALAAWNLDDDAGAVLPITAENVLDLSAADQLTLIYAARRLNAPAAAPAAAI